MPFLNGSSLLGQCLPLRQLITPDIILASYPPCARAKMSPISGSPAPVLCLPPRRGGSCLEIWAGSADLSLLP